MNMGGGSQGSSQQSTQGFRDLPPEIQGAFKDLALQAQSYLPGSQGATGFGGSPSGVPSSAPSSSPMTNPSPGAYGINSGGNRVGLEYTNGGFSSGGNPFTGQIINSNGTPYVPAAPSAASGGMTGLPSTAPTGGSTSMFTPLGQTAGETQAIGAINRGFTPDANRFFSDISMQQNPYDRFVLDEINRQSQGQNSILQQNMSRAGQFGSNRQLLGANDIDLSRINQIGGFLQGQYDKSANNALTVLPQSRLNDATAQLGAGTFQRGLAADTAQAPVNALARIAQILGVLPTNSGQSTGSSHGSSFSFGFSP